jgi:hypothetical protein
VLRGVTEEVRDMRHRFTGTIAAAVLAALPIAAAAQVSALSRTPDGRPNLQGIWQVLNTAAWDIQDHPARLGVPAGQGVVEGNELPYRPEALAKKRQNFENRSTADPESKGYLPGVPRIMYMPFPFQILQTRDHVVIAFEYSRGIRTIYTNGSQHPPGPVNWWMGDSRGHWEGDTLVVDVMHFTDQTWFDRAGNFHSDALHLIERFTLAGPDHINYEVTVDDPAVFTRPWKMSMPLYRRKERDIRLLEYDPGLLIDEVQAEQERRKPN